MENRNSDVTPGKKKPAKTSKDKKKKTSAIAAAGQGASAVDRAKHSSKSAVSGDSGLTNTGPHVNYDEDQ